MAHRKRKKTTKTITEEISEEKQEETKEIVELPPRKKHDPEEVEKVTSAAIKDSWRELVPYIIIIAVVVIIRTFIVTPIDVQGTSMYPTLHDNDIMLLYKLRLKTVGINRFDIVVVNSENDGKLIKRVIGMPGDKIYYKVEDDDDGNAVGHLYINGEEIEEDFLSDEASGLTCKWPTDICEGEVEIPKNHYFVMGDNRGNSKDSRYDDIGTIDISDIEGITSVVIWPISRFGSKN